MCQSEPFYRYAILFALVLCSDGTVNIIMTLQCREWKLDRGPGNLLTKSNGTSYRLLAVNKLLSQSAVRC